MIHRLLAVAFVAALALMPGCDRDDYPPKRLDNGSVVHTTQSPDGQTIYVWCVVGHGDGADISYLGSSTTDDSLDIDELLRRRGVR